MAFKYPDWSDPEVLAHPYYHYDKILHQNPFGFDERTKSWMVASYNDCFHLLKDPRLTVERTPLYRRALPQHEKITHLIDSLERWLLFVDGPIHDRLRTPIMRTIANQTQRLAKALIESEATSILDNLPQQTEIDLIADVAYKVPLHVICRLLGLPLNDADFLLRESKKVAYFFERSADLSIATHAAEGFALLEDYFTEVVYRKTTHKDDDLLSGLIGLQAEFPELTVSDIVGNAIFLLAAGHETATSLIASAFGLLLTHPNELAMLKSQPSLLAAAIEETLRLEPPVQRNGRLVKEDFFWQGHQLRKGQWVTILMAAANRDPALFPDPHRFMLTRDKARHLAFSNGPHYCAGAQLGKMEAAAVLEMTFKRYPGMTMLGSKLTYLPNQTFRCLSSLPVSLHSHKAIQKSQTKPGLNDTLEPALVDGGRCYETPGDSRNA